VVLDFSGVELATQSFIHALISALIRDDDLQALERLVFKGCNDAVATLISIVADYSQEVITDIPENATEEGETQPEAP
jgi:hypothetical protein